MGPNSAKYNYYILLNNLFIIIPRGFLFTQTSNEVDRSTLVTEYTVLKFIAHSRCINFVDGIS